MPKPDMVASSMAFGQRVVGDGGRPRPLLGLGGRNRGPDRRGAAPSRGGVVARELGVDLDVACPARGHQAAQQRPAQVGVDGQPVDGLRAVEQARNEVEVLRGPGHGDQGPRVGQLVVAAGVGRPQFRVHASGQALQVGVPVLGGRVQLDRGADLEQHLLDHADVGLGGQARTAPGPGSRRRTTRASRVMSQAAPQTSARGIGRSRSARCGDGRGRASARRGGSWRT